MTVERVGSTSREAFTPVAEGGIRHRFGESATSANPKTQTAGGRVSLSLLGDGFIEAIGDKEIAGNADQQRRRNDGIFGMVASAPVLEANGRPVPTENSGWPSKVSSTSQVTMLHALVLLKPQLNFDTDVADSLAPRLR